MWDYIESSYLIKRPVPWHSPIMWKYILAYHFKHRISGETEVAPCLFDFPVQAHLFKQAPWDFSVILLGGVSNSAVALQAPSRVIAAAPGPLPATAQQARGSTGAAAGVWAKGKYWAGPPEGWGPSHLYPSGFTSVVLSWWALRWRMSLESPILLVMESTWDQVPPSVSSSSSANQD